MAIALDSALGTTTRTTGTSKTQAFNNVAGTYLVAGVTVSNISDAITSVTYAGASMTRMVAASNTGNSAVLYALASPATGSNNIVITLSASRDIDMGAASYTGTSLTGQPDATTTATVSSGTSITETLTTLADNCWVVGTCGNQRGMTASTGCTLRSGVVGGGIYFDSNGAVTPAGSYSMTQTMSSGSAAGVSMSLFPASSGSQVKSADGVLIASIKSVDGITNV